MKLLSLLIFLTAFSGPVFAGWVGGGKWVPRGGKSALGFHLLGNVKLLHGSFGSKDNTTVSKKQMNGIGADATVALRVGVLFVGGGGEYGKFFQQSKTSDNFNLSGSMMNLFGAAGVSAGNFALMGRYYLSSKYDISKTSSSSEKVSYTTPTASYGAVISYRTGARSVLSLEYTQMGFAKEVRDGTTSKLASAMQLSTFGLSYGFIY